jgi:hypothetical protein
MQTTYGNKLDILGRYFTSYFTLCFFKNEVFVILPALIFPPKKYNHPRDMLELRHGGI